MRITVTSASTKAAAATIRSLLETAPSGTEIHALYRDPAKAPAEFTAYSSFHAVRGSIDDAASLDFSDSQAVLTVLPPIVQGSDPIERCMQMCGNVKEALKKARSVQRLVLLSSIGAEFESGTGELATNHVSEQVLSTAEVPEIIMARCAYFMENWTASLEGLKAPEPFFFSPLTPLDYALPMIAVKDIGINLAKSLTADNRAPSMPYIYDLWGPRDYTPLDVQRAFCASLGKPVDIKPVEQNKLPEFFGLFLSPGIADLYAEMTRSILPGGIAATDSKLRDTSRERVQGETGLEEAIRAAVTAGL